MTDHLLHAIDQRHGLSVVAALCTETAREAELRHFAGRIPATVMAQTVTGAALLSSPLKDGERQTVQISFGGVLRGVFAEADSDGNIRAYAVPAALAGLDSGGATFLDAIGGAASLAVVKSLDGEILYSGSVQSERPAPRFCLETYLAQSEQVESAIELHARYAGGEVVHAAGVVVRMLPGGDREAFRAVRERFGSGEVFELLTEGLGTEELVGRLLPGALAGELPVKRGLRFHCPCTRDRVHRMLAALGPKQIREIITEDGGTEVNCAFCNATYEVSAGDLEALAASVEGDGGSDRERDLGEAESRGVPFGGGGGAA